MVLVTFRRCATIATTLIVLAGFVLPPAVRAAGLRQAGSISESIADLSANYPPEPRITTSPTNSVGRILIVECVVVNQICVTKPRDKNDR